MSRLVSRTLEAYSIHGHTRSGSVEEENLNYTNFFEQLSQSNPGDRRQQSTSDVIAVPEIIRDGNKLGFHFIIGSPDELSLIYDIGTGTAERVDPGKGRFVANSAWAIVQPDIRLLLLERRRPGVAIRRIENFLIEYSRQLPDLSGLSISLNPIPSPSFADEVAKFTRIREAEIILRRPNGGFTDTANNMLSQMADSNGAELGLHVRADRGQSLSKTDGIVSEVLALAQKPINALKNAVIKGRRPDYNGERVVSLQKHAVKGSTRVDPQADSQATFEALMPLAQLLANQTQGISEHQP